jgi:hypothetical protein
MTSKPNKIITAGGMISRFNTTITPIVLSGNDRRQL